MGSATSQVMDASSKEQVETEARAMLSEFKTHYAKYYPYALLTATASELEPAPVSPFRLSEPPTAKRPLKTGYLTKEGFVKHSWKKRYFVVRQDYTVEYFENEQAYLSHAKPKGTIACGGYTVFETLDGFQAHTDDLLTVRLGVCPPHTKSCPVNTFVLDCEGRRPWYVAAESVQERREWVETFRLCGLRSSGLLDNAKEQREAFQSSLASCRRVGGLSDHNLVAGTEVEVLAASVMEKLRAAVLEVSVYPKIREQPEKTRQSIYDSVEMELLSEVTAEAKGTYEEALALAETFRKQHNEALTRDVPSLAGDLKRYEQQVRRLVEPALAPELRTLAAPTALMVAEGCIEPLDRAGDSLMRLWSLHIAEAMPALRNDDKSAIELLPTVVEEFDPKPILDGKLGIVTQLGGKAPNLVELSAQLRSLLANSFTTFSQGLWSGKDPETSYDETLDLVDNDVAMWLGMSLKRIAMALVMPQVKDAAVGACESVASEATAARPPALEPYVDPQLMVDHVVALTIEDCVQAIAFRVAELEADDDVAGQARSDLGFELMEAPRAGDDYEEPVVSEDDDEESLPAAKSDYRLPVPLEQQRAAAQLSGAPLKADYAEPPVTSQVALPLEEMPWYHGILSRGDAERRVKATSKDFPFGTTIFLVRKSISSPRDFAITCLKVGMGDAAGKALIIHLIVKARDQGFRAELPSKEPQPTFPTLGNLVDFYRLTATLGTPFGQLTSSVPRPEPLQTVLGDAELQRASVHDNKPLAEQDLGEQLIAEGYLLKIRGVGQNRRRFFRLTNKSFMYFTEEAGELLADIPVNDIKAATNVHKTQFRLVTKHPFGASSAATDELLLKAPDVRVKNCWLRALQQSEDLSASWRQQSQPGKLKAEGYLKKVVGGVSKSRMRWFVLTDESLAYYFKQGDERMAILKLDDITTVCGTSDKREFRVVANKKFSVSGHSEVTLRSPTAAARNRWVKALISVLPPDKVVH
eukprot:m.35013 g.35013  ORF g.35013 m.35013 type:complete len:982 (+) comp10886_c0_seq2:109-3054(+)